MLFDEIRIERCYYHGSYCRLCCSNVPSHYGTPVRIHEIAFKVSGESLERLRKSADMVFEMVLGQQQVLSVPVSQFQPSSVFHGLFVYQIQGLRGKPGNGIELSVCYGMAMQFDFIRILVAEDKLAKALEQTRVPTANPPIFSGPPAEPVGNATALVPVAPATAPIERHRRGRQVVCQSDEDGDI